MKWFANLRIVYKLGCLIVLAVLSLSVVGYAGYYYVAKANEDLAAMYKHNLLPVQFLNDSEAQSRHFQVDMLELMLAKDAKRLQDVREDMDKRIAAFAADLEAYEKTGLDPFEAETLKKLREEVKNYRGHRDAIIQLSLQSGKNAEEIYIVYAQTVVPRMDAFQNYTQELAAYSVKKAKEKNAQNQTDFERSRLLILGIFLASSGLFVFCAWLIARMITSPIQEMVAVVGELAGGDFRARPRRGRGQDEMGRLGDGLEAMRSSLQGLMKQVNESAEQVAAASEQLTAGADQSAQVATQVAVSITAVAGDSAKQTEAVDETAAVVAQMSAGVQQVATNTNLAAAKAGQAAETAKEGGESVEKAINQMLQIEQAVNNSAQVVVKLGGRSVEIGQIVDTISGIAGQTNLLALNAAIEAARAGEQGRGFAVVAEEVRTLAEQSQAAAKQIAALIAEIQGDTDEAIAAMGQGTKEVNAGTQVVTEAGQAFGEIAELVLQVAGQVKEISAAIQQLASGSQRIVASVREIEGVSKNTAGEAQTVSAATEEQAASMEEIAAASQGLAKMAQELREGVGKFQI